jgi:hypothetical protein
MRAGVTSRQTILYPRMLEAAWDPRLVWTDAENLAPNWIRSTDRPARSKDMSFSCRKWEPSSSAARTLVTKLVDLYK